MTTAGDFAAYRTDSGAVFVGRLSTGAATQIDPFPSEAEDGPQYTADAIAVDDRGILFSYSRTDGSVVRYDIAASEVRGRDVLEADGLTTPVITAGGDDGPWWTPRTATSGCAKRMPRPRSMRRAAWSSAHPTPPQMRSTSRPRPRSSA